jgi:PAS domain-containing protein
MMTLIDGIWLFLLCLVAAALALLAVALFDRRIARARGGLFADPASGTVFLFDGEALLDASAGARALLSASARGGTAWHRFMAYAAPRFPGVEAQLDRLPDLGRIEIASPGAEGFVLLAEWRSGVRRITLADPQLDGASRLVDPLVRKAQEDELVTLRRITDDTPHPVWQEAADGRVIWANRACVDLALRLGGRDGPVGWPLPRLLDADQAGRLPLHLADRPDPLWFDLQVIPFDGGRTVFALPAETAVQAETALRSFVQTLTKTFAHLPIGLAIFDRQRRLQLFNPALTDLVGLPVDFLSARPALFAFLDAMRERGMIPEPRDYKAWRDQMAALEQSAIDGRYEETWALPHGLTYRVIGRPHPEGALALLFQDISDEIARTRRMRADLEIGQSVIDAMDEALAVFSPTGQLVMTNLAYARLWAQDPMETLANHPIAALAETWRAACAPSHFWALAEGYVAAPGPREPWVSQARLNDGRALRCRLAPLTGGATLVGFAADPLPERQVGLTLAVAGDTVEAPAILPRPRTARVP